MIQLRSGYINFDFLIILMTLYNQIDSNKRRSAILIGLFLVIVIALGWVISRVYGSPIILYLAVFISIAQALISYYSGDKVALAVSGAREIQKKDNPALWNLVENLSITSGLPMPKVYIIDDPAPNAFATGRDPQHSSIAVTSGLIERLEKIELEGVIAHELSHVGNYDIRLMMIVVVLVGVIALISDLFIRVRFLFGGGNDRNSSSGTIWLIIAIVAAILAPIIATLVQLAISRRREFLADSTGALLTRYPEGLASALEKISAYKKPMQRVSSATSHLFIANPFGKTGSYFSKIFSTHPPTEERIHNLRGMEK